MMTRLFHAVAMVCVATVMTGLILAGYFAFRGTLNMGSATQIIALLNGIDITGSRLQRIVNQQADREQPDFDEILRQRTLQSHDLQMRLRSQETFHRELAEMLSQVQREREQLAVRTKKFSRQLDEIRTEALQEGLRQAGRTLQMLEAEAAKDQLLVMFNEKREDEVVTMIQAMPSDKRRDILAEFASEEEKQILATILRLISEGRPTTALIDQARENR